MYNSKTNIVNNKSYKNYKTITNHLKTISYGLVIIYIFMDNRCAARDGLAKKACYSDKMNHL